jgi:NTE family protein
MDYHFRNLVFEGGGVKGIATLGALEVLQEKGILPQIIRVGGTSVGAINAALIALGYGLEDQTKTLWGLDFNKFQDSNRGIFRNAYRVVKKFGWNKGDFCRVWLGELVSRKLKNPGATFKDLRAQGKKDLYVYGTNLCTRFGEVFSAEHTPEMSIVDAVRISMSFPVFFAAVRNAKNEVFVDGGCLNNYPVKLFDREKYILEENRGRMGVMRPYYKTQNEEFLKVHPGRSPYVYNKETLGFRLDSKKETAAFRYGEVGEHKIEKFRDYVKELAVTMLSSQDNAHLHSDDWQRTVYINTLGISTLQFKLSDDDKKALVQSGRDGAREYFKWYDAGGADIVNRPEYREPG